MLCWRICRRRFAGAAGSGEGARQFGGRWNSRGVAMVYASTSLALAAIETFVHLEPNLSPRDLVSIAGEIPDDFEVSKLDPRVLPRGWQRAGDEGSRHWGDAWARSGKSVALLVPSAPIRGEWNVLLNPAHGEYQRVRWSAPVRFEFDARMLR